MTRTIPLTRRRVVVVLQLISYPLTFALSYAAGLTISGASLSALVFFAAVSAYLYYKTGLWQFGNAPDGQLDERQVQVRNRAYRLAYAGVCMLIMLFLAYLQLAPGLQWPIPSGSGQINPLFWGVYTFIVTLPSAILAWTETEM